MFRDTLIIAGSSVCILIGAWQIYAPAAWIIGGVLMFISGVVWAAYEEQKKRGRK